MKSNLTAATDVTRTAGAYRARLQITSSAGFAERVLENPRCEILTDSVALVIALSADPSGDGLQRDELDEGLAVAVSAHASALLGALPEPALGVGGAIAVEAFSALRFELHGTYYLRQSATFDQSTLGGDFDLIAFGARGCRTWSFGAFDLAPCVGAELYHVTASGRGGMVSHSGEGTWGGPAAGVFGRLRLVEAFAIYIAADGVVPLSRQGFVFSDVVGPVYRASAIAFAVLVASEVRF